MNSIESYDLVTIDFAREFELDPHCALFMVQCLLVDELLCQKRILFLQCLSGEYLVHANEQELTELNDAIFTISQRGVIDAVTSGVLDPWIVHTLTCNPKGLWRAHNAALVGVTGGNANDLGVRDVRPCANRKAVKPQCETSEDSNSALHEVQRVRQKVRKVTSLLMRFPVFAGRDAECSGTDNGGTRVRPASTLLQQSGRLGVAVVMLALGIAWSVWTKAPMQEMVHTGSAIDTFDVQVARLYPVTGQLLETIPEFSGSGPELWEWYCGTDESQKVFEVEDDYHLAALISELHAGNDKIQAEVVMRQLRELHIVEEGLSSQIVDSHVIIAMSHGDGFQAIHSECYSDVLGAYMNVTMGDVDDPPHSMLEMDDVAMSFVAEGLSAHTVPEPGSGSLLIIAIGLISLSVAYGRIRSTQFRH